MTVNLTRIYTKLGDGGETHLGDMSRVSKLHPRVEAYGTVDELNAPIGLALLAEGMPPRFAEWLGRVQNDLLDVGADLSVPRAEGGDEARERLRVGPDYTAWLEQACDEVNEKLPPLRSFVIPGGTPVGLSVGFSVAFAGFWSSFVPFRAARQVAERHERIKTSVR